MRSRSVTMKVTWLRPELPMRGVVSAIHPFSKTSARVIDAAGGAR
jgi:hypothetical protein